MGYEVLGRNGGQLIAQSTDDKPVCRYGAWLELMDMIVKHTRSQEFVCSRHLKAHRIAPGATRSCGRRVRTMSSSSHSSCAPRLAWRSSSLPRTDSSTAEKMNL